MITATTGATDPLGASLASSKQQGTDQFAQVLASVAGTMTDGGSSTSATSVAPRTILGSSAAAQLFATPQEEQDFAADLTQRLRAAGVDTSQPIQFQVQSDGSVVAKDGTPDKQKIDAVFAADPAFANEYRKIANTEETKAIVKVELGYEQQAQGLSQAAQQALWQQRYAGQVSSIEAQGADLTLAGATISLDS